MKKLPYENVKLLLETFKDTSMLVIDNFDNSAIVKKHIASHYESMLKLIGEWAHE